MAKATSLQIHLPPNLEAMFKAFMSDGGYSSRSNAGLNIVQLGLGVSDRTVLDLPVKLRQKILSYQRDNDFDSFEDSVVALLELATRIVDNSKENDDEGVTNRELLEETLKRVNRILDLNNMNFIDTKKIRDPESVNQEILDTMKGINARADERTEKFINGELE